MDFIIAMLISISIVDNSFQPLWSMARVAINFTVIWWATLSFVIQISTYSNLLFSRLLILWLLMWNAFFRISRILLFTSLPLPQWLLHFLASPLLLPLHLLQLQKSSVSTIRALNSIPSTQVFVHRSPIKGMLITMLINNQSVFSLQVNWIICSS